MNIIYFSDEYKRNIFEEKAIFYEYMCYISKNVKRNKLNKYNINKNSLLGYHIIIFQFIIIYFILNCYVIK